MLSPKGDSQQVVLNCFSPGVMIATFVVEVALAGYVVWRYKMRAAEQITVVLLLCLATFQLAEYNICEGDPARMVWWTKFGLCAISLLPALGLHLTSLVTKRTRSTWIAYGAAAIAIATFALVPQATNGAQCTGNYVIIHSQDNVGLAFGSYYWFFLLLLVTDVYYTLQNKSLKLTQRNRSTLRWMAIGYACFMVPMIVAYFISPVYSQGAPSIMCGFAVIFAFILTFEVIPNFKGQKTGRGLRHILQRSQERLFR